VCSGTAVLFGKDEVDQQHYVAGDKGHSVQKDLIEFTRNL